MENHEKEHQENSQNETGEKELSDASNEPRIDESSLPEGVTFEPQDSEQINIRDVKASDLKWLPPYLKTTDDKGDLLGDQSLEERVVQTCKDLREKRFLKIENPESLAQEITDLVVTYATKINATDNSLTGILTKYRIRLGMLLVLQKWIVTKLLKQEWLEYFDKNYNTRQLRSYQDFMRLAQYPNSIKYAWLGKERLLQLITVIGVPESADPIGDYLKLVGLEFDPEEEPNYEDLKLKADVAIFRQKLSDYQVYDIPDEKIESMIIHGVRGTTSILDQFKLVKDTHGDLDKFADKLIETKGKVPLIITPEKKAESFKKSLDRFIDQAKSALDDEDYLKELDIESINELQNKINALKDKIEQRSE